MKCEGEGRIPSMTPGSLVWAACWRVSCSPLQEVQGGSREVGGARCAAAPADNSPQGSSRYHPPPSSPPIAPPSIPRCLYLHDCFILWPPTVPFKASLRSDRYPHVWGLCLSVASSGSQFAFHIPPTFYSTFS